MIAIGGARRARENLLHGTGIDRHTRSRLAAALAVGALGVTIVGCSSSPASTTASSAGSQADIPIRVVASTTTTNFMPFYVAQANGYFKDEGLNVSLEEVNGGSATELAGFVNNQYNALLGAPSDVVLGEEKGVISPDSGKFIAELVGANYDLVTSRSITKISQIAGTKVGISSANGSDQVFIEAIMKYYHIPTTSVTWIDSGPIAARITALSTGAIQVSAISASSRSVSEKVGNILVPATKAPISTIGSGIFVSKELDAHTAELKKFVAAMVKATNWMRSDPSGASSVCQKAISSTAALCSASDQALLNKSISGDWTLSSTEAVDQALLNQTIKVVRELNPAYKLNLTAAEMTDTSVAGTTP